MVHNNVSLTVSANEAARVDDEAKRRLLASKKLSLVVDLDQTIIHATVDPTVADWQGDEENPNHEAVKDVQSFLLKDEGIGKGGAGCWYYIKLRPGLKEFLENVAKIYELHIYTMGTRQYAKNIADIIDPEHKIFGDRILSRDESGSMTAKNLQRLFPVDTKMVVIIDDRGDVWKWSPNLIKVTPYDFFVGIGDINSSFLPKKPDLRIASKPATDSISQSANEVSTETSKVDVDVKTNGTGDHINTAVPDVPDDSPVDNKSSPFEQLVAMSGGDGSTIRDEQTNSQDELLAVQLEEKPLLQKQRQLEANDAAAETAAALEEREDGKLNSEEAKDFERSRHGLLQDNDRELFHLEESLRSVHTAFFNAYSQQLAAAQGGRLGKLRGGQKQKSPTDKSDLDLVPDIKTILPTVKSKVLGDTFLIFSGIVPLGMDVGSTDIAILAKSFGAVVQNDVTRSTTHVVAARNRTQKVRTAIRRGRGRIKIVSPQWLLESIASWQKKDEAAYLLDVEEGRNGSFHDEDALSESESVATEVDDPTDSDASHRRDRPPLSISIKGPSTGTDGDESDAEELIPSEWEVDDKSPVGGSNEDWNAMNDELADFLGSEAEDGDNVEDDEDAQDSEASTSSKLSLRGRKRHRKENDESDSGSDRDFQQRRSKKLATGKRTAPTLLSQSTTADDEDTILATQADNGKNGAEDPGQGGEEGGEDQDEHKEGDGWSDFEEEDFEAELERAASEEHGE